MLRLELPAQEANKSVAVSTRELLRTYGIAMNPGHEASLSPLRPRFAGIPPLICSPNYVADVRTDNADWISQAAIKFYDLLIVSVFPSERRRNEEAERSPFGRPVGA